MMGNKSNSMPYLGSTRSTYYYYRKRLIKKGIKTYAAFFELDQSEVKQEGFHQVPFICFHRNMEFQVIKTRPKCNWKAKPSRFYKTLEAKKPTS